MRKDQTYPKLDSKRSKISMPNLEVFWDMCCLRIKPFHRVDSSIIMFRYRKHKFWNLLLRCRMVGQFREVRAVLEIYSAYCYQQLHIYPIIILSFSRGKVWGKKWSNSCFFERYYNLVPIRIKTAKSTSTVTSSNFLILKGDVKELTFFLNSLLSYWFHIQLGAHYLYEKCFEMHSLHTVQQCKTGEQAHKNVSCKAGNESILPYHLISKTYPNVHFMFSSTCWLTTFILITFPESSIMYYDCQKHYHHPI